MNNFFYAILDNNSVILIEDVKMLQDILCFPICLLKHATYKKGYTAR